VTWATDPAETAASYERVSRQVQALYGHGLKRQERNVDEMARELRVILPSDLRFRDGVDDNASGAAMSLPALDRVVELARAGRFKTLLVAGTDRWTRESGKGMWLTRQVREYGVRVVWGDLPDVPDPGDGNPYAAHWRQKMESEAFQSAEFERALIRWRTMNGRRDKAAAGQVVGQGTAPYGYVYVRDDTPKHRVCGLEPDSKQAAIVRDLYQRALRMSLDALLDWLNAARVPPPGARRTYRKPQYKASAGQLWSGHTLYNILTSRLYVGEYTYHTTGGQVPAIVSESTFEEVQSALSGRRGQRGAGRRGTQADEFLFRGRLVCAPCSAAVGRRVTLHAKRANSAGERYYACPHRWQHHTRSVKQIGLVCPLPSIRAGLLEQQVWDAIIAACLEPERLRAELADARARRRQDDRGREDRLAAIQATIAQQERLLAVHVKRIAELEAEGTPEADVEMPLQMTERDQVRSRLVSLKRDLREAEAMPGPGLSEAESDAIEQLADVVRTAGAAATPAERRQAVEILDLRATLGEGSESILVQLRPRRAIPMEWRGAISVRVAQPQSSDCDASFLKFTLQLLLSRLDFAA
jgi:DNA invertase Pin-like site-specific DNA recombinase